MFHVRIDRDKIFDGPFHNYASAELAKERAERSFPDHHFDIVEVV